MRKRERERPTEGGESGEFVSQKRTARKKRFNKMHQFRTKPEILLAPREGEGREEESESAHKRERGRETGKERVRTPHFVGALSLTAHS